MSIQVAIEHTTEYHFDRPVNLAPHLIRLRPAPHVRTPVHKYSLKVTPEKHFLNWLQDPFGNYIARYVFPEKTSRMSISVDLVADMTVINPFDFFVEPQSEKFPFDYPPQLRKELEPYFERKEAGPRLMEWVGSVERSPLHIVDFLVGLNQRLEQEIGYVIRMEPGVQTCEQTLTEAKGSCRDSAWLLVQILRHLNLAARFVSGYLVQLRADVAALEGPSGPAEDFTDLHAWAEVFVPGAGWLGLDPTSGLFAGEGHIPLACTPDYVSAAPVTGATDPCEVEFRFRNHVERLHEDPRVTKPYTDDEWSRILNLGDSVDGELQAGDVRLTLGGEPTFVSIDDMDGDEWNTAALGAHKRERAEVLLRRLWQRFATGGLLHHGQGKWYPGEPLPRWALSVLWRDDSEALWERQDLLADPSRPGENDSRDAERFGHALAGALGLSKHELIPGYEDVLYYLWKEGTLPLNLDPTDSRLSDRMERDRLRRLFEQGLDRVIGFALPLVWDYDSDAWKTGPWRFRREHMFLLPGDSPMGLRLPLDALVWEPRDKRYHPPPRDTFEPREGLSDIRGEVQRRYTERLSQAPAGQTFSEQMAADYEQEGPQTGVVRTALCIEPRDGSVHLFLPPLTHLEHYVDLIHSIEKAAAETSVPVVLEGYEPPHDPRLKRLQVTPDPGVIEVNIHPSASWRTLVENTGILYEEARQSRLGTEKFMLDGRHTGTGGGNHVTLGGATPADSPFLRRPDLLRSLVLYWQNHPSLSYLFSGLFIGPTSQAPRVDEARDETLYELELAFRNMPTGEAPSPWLVDRIIRNLMVDVTGNTHRTEFCVDKLYSPDSPTGRLGLVEFRGFEMPPHARMSSVQMLLLRALVARFWKQPYRRPPLRWGTELHDRFMLPHFVERDFDEVLEELRHQGYAFEKRWFAPFFEFRFPRYGTVQVQDIELELRFAIEPWHVLGEEVTSQGTARFVDSSVERLQIRADGLTPDRYAVACNGRQVPLRNTGRRGQYVAGVRYKAWRPVSGLHPTIDVHAPLVFDLVDTWNDRSIGGCTYHVAHPGGRNYETLPVNANEAQARRLARFFEHGHTPGGKAPPPEQPHDDYPYTLDLRFPARR